MISICMLDIPYPVLSLCTLHLWNRIYLWTWYSEDQLVWLSPSLPPDANIWHTSIPSLLFSVRREYEFSPSSLHIILFTHWGNSTVTSITHILSAQFCGHICQRQNIWKPATWGSKRTSRFGLWELSLIWTEPRENKMHRCILRSKQCSGADGPSPSTYESLLVKF